MEADKKEKKVQPLIKEIRRVIDDELSGSPHKIEAALKLVVENLKDGTIGLLAVLHHHGSLKKLLEYSKKLL